MTTVNEHENPETMQIEARISSTEHKMQIEGVAVGERARGRVVKASDS